MGDLRHLLFAIFVGVLSTSAMAHDVAPLPSGGSCSMPVNYTAEGSKNLFNEQQEQWLGEIADASMRRSFHVINDPDAYLQRIGERLLAQLPPTIIPYHFVIVDSPGLNSFGLAGGRIYIYRRMISFAKSEDELAALLGHEIGHMIMHQAAIDISEWFRAVGITSVGDRQDIFNKWNQLQDNVRKLKKRPDGGHGQQEQLIADRIGLYALMRAGYDPAQFASFADRSFQTKGKTGGFWSD
jgi:predicted Zn-dependent protease